MTDSHRKEFFSLVTKAFTEVQPDMKKEPWRKAEMLKAVGTESTKDVGDSRKFDRLMAHFEELAQNDIKYGLRLINGDAVRMRHVLKKNSATFCDQFADNLALQNWLRGIAKQSLRKNELPELHHLTDPQFDVVRQAACIHANR